MSDEPRPVGDALDAVRRELRIDAPAGFAALEAAWPDLVGPALAAHSRPRALREGVLSVLADGPAWAGQMSYLDEVLVARIAVEVPSARVREVRVTVAREGPAER